MEKIKIEFFHDTVCSYCFPMSGTVRQAVNKYENLEILHRSYALTWKEEDFIEEFGSREEAKRKVTKYWEIVNKKFPDYAFNAEGMRRSASPIPVSKQGLIAAKAAGMLGGEEKYWDMFDKIQQGLFVESKNTENEEVLANMAADVGLDVEAWRSLFVDSKTEEAVLRDFDLVHSYGVKLVPTLIVDGKYKIEGTKTLLELEEELKKIAEIENKVLK